ncbi:MAG: hypothetical protein K0M67_03355 [Thiobacillus sp.]|nr:hypothetical protein [Thiobacillus sp.]
MDQRHSAAEAVKDHIRALPATMSKGQRALESLGYYRSARLPVPDEVLRQIDHCYQHFMSGKPVAGWTGVERNKPAPMTLGDAFGVPDIKGGEKSALKRKRLALVEPFLVALFTGQGVTKLRRTKEGYDQAARELGLTVKEVEGWVTKYLAKRQPKRSPD